MGTIGGGNNSQFPAVPPNDGRRIPTRDLVSGFQLYDQNFDGALNKNEAANLYLHYRESGQMDKAAFIATWFVGGTDGRGLVPDFNGDGLVAIDEVALLGRSGPTAQTIPSDFDSNGNLGGPPTLIGGTDPYAIEPEDFQAVFPGRFNPGGNDIANREGEILQFVTQPGLPSLPGTGSGNIPPGQMLGNPMVSMMLTSMITGVIMAALQQAMGNGGGFPGNGFPGGGFPGGFPGIGIPNNGFVNPQVQQGLNTLLNELNFIEPESPQAQAALARIQVLARQLPDGGQQFLAQHFVPIDQQGTLASRQQLNSALNSLESLGANLDASSPQARALDARENSIRALLNGGPNAIELSELYNQLANTEAGSTTANSIQARINALSQSVAVNFGNP
ncbi:MAG: hypothetical protein SFZ03_00830 [Candidatus Melainabacteria bacterium]|nr:hypothetical protein [Candidatus Melainabacteria bacterium]